MEEQQQEEEEIPATRISSSHQVIPNSTGRTPPPVFIGIHRSISVKVSSI